MVAITNASGSILSQQRYLPFGGVRTDLGPITQTDFGFTGQRNIASIVLYDYHARMYDPLIGRFIQPDSIIPNAGPQSLNRYSYVFNNPIGLIDPFGNDPWGCVPDSPGEQDCITREQNDYNASIKKLQKRDDNSDSGSGGGNHHWTLSSDISVGFTIGSNASINSPDYSSDYYYEEEIACSSGEAWICIAGDLSFFSRFPYVNPNKVTPNNIWIDYHVDFNESSGTTISNIQIVNYYKDPVVLNQLLIEGSSSSGLQYHFPQNTFLPHGFGSSYQLPAPNSPYSSRDSIKITVNIGYIVNLNNGPSVIYRDLTVQVPPLVGVKQYLQTGTIPQP